MSPEKLSAWAALSVSALTAPAGAVGFAIEGNSSISSEAIIESASEVACAGVDSVCVDAMCNAVADRYWEIGYFDVRISCLEPGAGGDTVRISITEGMQASLKSVTIGGAAACDSAGLEAVFDQQVGRPFTGAGLEQGQKAQLRPIAVGDHQLMGIGDPRQWGDRLADIGLLACEARRFASQQL